jgi:hypothetical protein
MRYKLIALILTLGFILTLSAATLFAANYMTIRDINLKAYIINVIILQKFARDIVKIQFIFGKLNMLI